jgi:hypothetical protein
MRSYESELMHPVKGLLFGDLLTALLIQVALYINSSSGAIFLSSYVQMQKLKVHTESAMLTMDQVYLLLPSGRSRLNAH